MAVSVPLAPAAARKPSRPSLWQLGIESQVLTTEIAQLADGLDADDPEQRALAIADLEGRLLLEESNRELLERRADAYCFVVGTLRAQAAHRQAQARRLQSLALVDQARADALESTLVTVLTRLQPAATRFSFPHHELTSRRSEAVEITQADALPAELMRITTATAPDKSAIKAALKAGTAVPGAQLVSRRSWSIH
jgi:hypothetical protein